MSVNRVKTLEQEADSGTLSRSELDELVRLLDSSDQAVRDTAAEAIKTYSKNHPNPTASVVEELCERVTESDQSSTRQSNLGEALSQIALEQPETVEPVAETLFSFTTNPWKYFSFSDGVAAIAARSEETRQMLQDQIENGSKAERNNALFILSKVGEEHPEHLEPFVPLFASILEDESRYLKERGQAATCFARANPDHGEVDPTALETLIHSEESVAVEGALDGLLWIVSNDPSRLDPAVFQERLDELRDRESSDVSLWSDDREKAEALYEVLSEIETEQPEASGGSPTKVYTSDTESTSSPATATSGPTPASDTSPSFCPSCGTDLQEWDDPSFCVDCGTDLSS